MTETSSAAETASTPLSDLPTPLSDAKSAAAAARPPPSKAGSNSLASLLRALPSSTDAFMAHLQRCLATPSGIDTLLLFVCYASRFTGAALTDLSAAFARRRTSREILALVFTLPPRAAVILEKGSPATPARTAAARLAALLGQRLKALGSLASETRTIMRLWALVGMYFWARRLVAEAFGPSQTTETEKDGGEVAPRRGKLVALVDWAQLLSVGAFQVLENGAYLSGRGVLGWTPAQQGRAYVVGSRWLGVYTALELGRLLAQLVAAREKGAYSEASAEDREEIDDLRRNFAIDMAWAPLTAHWAVETGFLSDLAVGAGGCIPGVLKMRKLWRDTA